MGGTTVFWLYPDQGLVIVMTTNLFEAPDLRPAEIVDLFLPEPAVPPDAPGLP